MPCHPMETSLLPPPPPEFGHETITETDNGLLFNINDLPPPIPDSPAPAYLTSQVSPGPQRSHTNNITQTSKPTGSVPIALAPQTTTANPPWEQPMKSPSKPNSKGDAPPPTLAKKGKKLNSNFLAQLNSTLGGVEKTNPATTVSTSRPVNSAAVAQLKNTRSKESPPRGHLLSEIHGGVKLKKATNVNDRSAPSL